MTLAALAETGDMEDIVRGLKTRKPPILLISHNLDRVFRLSDRIGMLRRGRRITVRPTASAAKNEIVQ